MNLKEPHTLPSHMQTPGSTEKRYDSVHAVLAPAFDIFIIYKDDCTYPEYLLTYKVRGPMRCTRFCQLLACISCIATHSSRC